MAKGIPTLADIKPSKHSMDFLFTGSSQAKEKGDWGQIEPHVIANIVWAATITGGNVQFGMTKDRTSYVLKFFFGIQRDPMYFVCDDAGRDEITQLSLAMLEAAANHV